MDTAQWGFFSVAVGWTGKGDDMMICIFTWDENGGASSSECVYDIDVTTISTYLDPSATDYKIEFGDGIQGAFISGVVFEQWF